MGIIVLSHEIYAFFYFGIIAHMWSLLWLKSKTRCMNFEKSVKFVA